MAHSPLEHVLDTDVWVIFDTLFGGVRVRLWNIYGFQITKFMLLELIAAGLILAIFIPLSRWAARGSAPKGPFWNAFESLLTFIRNDVAKPNLGEEEADTYVPFLWTMFLFILFCNLLGMLPLMGSPTASIYMTLGLAIIAFVLMHACAVVKMGPWKYLKSLWPHLEIMPYPGAPAGGHGHNGHGHDAHDHHGHEAHAAPAAPQPARAVALWEWPLWLLATVFGLAISLMIFVIELAGTVIKSGVLALRLFANMFAGHLVVAAILLLIVSAGNALGLSWTWGLATGISVVGVVALSLLELFVAFLQAFVFVFLTSLFMGLALHPSH
jgi:F-type H+-transporting ATPase subunit a